MSALNLKYLRNDLTRWSTNWMLRLCAALWFAAKDQQAPTYATPHILNFGSHSDGLCSTPVHTSLPEGWMGADAACDWCRSRCLWFQCMLNIMERAMATYSGPRSCTWTELPGQVSSNFSSLAQRTATTSSCDLTLLTCLLIGSYRFCLIPLLALFSGKGRQLWRRKYDLEVNSSSVVVSGFGLKDLLFCFFFVLESYYLSI